MNIWSGLKTLGVGIVGTLICTYIIQPIISRSIPVSKTAWQRIIDNQYTTLSSFSVYRLIAGTSCVIISLLLCIWTNQIQGDIQVYDSIVEIQVVNIIIKIILKIPVLMTSITMVLLNKIAANMIKYRRFHHNIVKITPYISLREIDILKSDWTRMKCKADYENILDRIEKVIEDNKLD